MKCRKNIIHILLYYVTYQYTITPYLLGVLSSSHLGYPTCLSSMGKLPAFQSPLVLEPPRPALTFFQPVVEVCTGKVQERATEAEIHKSISVTDNLHILSLIWVDYSWFAF